jgi:hypothetical protein
MPKSILLTWVLIKRLQLACGQAAGPQMRMKGRGDGSQAPPRRQRKVNPRATQRVTTMDGPVPAAIVGGTNGVNTPVLTLML